MAAVTSSAQTHHSYITVWQRTPNKELTDLHELATAHIYLFIYLFLFTANQM